VPNAGNNTQAVRDELVRAVMPELRTLVEHLVKTTIERAPAPALDARGELEAAIERALAPLAAKQRELEAALAELRLAELKRKAAPSVAAQRAPELTTSRASADLAPRSMPIGPAVNVAPRPSAALAVASDANAPWELPAGLNGSRRKRAVIWILAIGVVLLLLTVAGLAVLSNTGRYL
jgi:hypothetical protein